MTSENRNMILAAVLSVVVLVGWQFLSPLWLPDAPEPVAVAEAPVAGADTSTPAAVPGEVGVAGAPTAPVSSAAEVGGVKVIRAVDDVLAATPRVVVDTPRLSGSINLVGARLDDLQLKDYRQTIEKDSPLVRLLAPSGTAEAEFVGFGWMGAGAPPADARWTASANRLTPEQSVTLSWTSPEGLLFEQVYSVDRNFLFTVQQRVQNQGAQTVALRNFGYVNQTGTGEDNGRFNVHVGPIGVLDGSLLEGDIAYKKLRSNGTKTIASNGGWLGITDAHWLTALIPDQKVAIEGRFTATADDRYQADWLQPAVAIAPGQTASTTSHLFAGAKEMQLLKDVRDQLSAPLFDRALAWGWFWFLAQPIFTLLQWLYGLFGNYALAIVGLTLIVRAILFPLANKQYASMAKMRIFAPRMKEIQSKYKDDKQKQQTELMELYKREKINPLAGCMPILLQIPIFYALYKTLLIAVEIRHQPGFLWIKDLSGPDPLTPVNLFGLIPWDPPSLLHLGILPILLGVTMWLQFRMNPQPMDEIQQKIFSFMPWIFMFMMAPFQAGLQIYWIVNNLVSLLQQWVLLRKYPMPAPAPTSKTG